MLVSKIDLPQVDQLFKQVYVIKALTQSVANHQTHDYQDVIAQIENPQFDTIVNQILSSSWSYTTAHLNFVERNANYDNVIAVLDKYQSNIKQLASDYERLALIERHRQLFESHQHNDEH